MPHVDSLLSLAHRQGADEVRLGDGRAPSILARGTAKRLAIPATSADTLRDLLGELLSDAVEAQLASGKKAELSHAVAGIGTFRVTLARRDGALEAQFHLVSSAPAAAGPASAPASATASASAAGAVAGAGTASAPTSAAPSASAPTAPILVPSDPRVLAALREVAPEPLEPPPAQGTTDDLMRLLLRAVAMRASDLHLAAGEAPHVRVDGVLHVLSDVGAVDAERLVSPLLDARALERVSGGVSADLAVGLVDPDGDARGRLPRVRGNVYRSARGLVAAFRLLPPEAPSLEALGHGGLLTELPLLPNGLVIVCGPTGSGKSTTLAALAQDALRRRSIVLVTLEDPIEYALGAHGGRQPSLVRQRQIGRDARDFATGLRDALREDPDVVLVGEMRDADSISLALTAAETGHLVLTTLHSRSAASAIERIVDSYPEGRQAQIRAQLADSLRAVVAQRLVPRAHAEGRALALEVLRVTPSVANGLREGKIATVTSAMQSGRRDGMVTLEKSLAELVRRGEVKADDAAAVANDRDMLATYRSGTA